MSILYDVNIRSDMQHSNWNPSDYLLQYRLESASCGMNFADQVNHKLQVQTGDNKSPRPEAKT